MSAPLCSQLTLGRNSVLDARHNKGGLRAVASPHREYISECTENVIMYQVDKKEKPLIAGVHSVA